MDKALNEFVHHRNVALYTRQLRFATDATQRALLMSRLAEERMQAKTKGWNSLIG
jgi:hypothetical protein